MMGKITLLRTKMMPPPQASAFVSRQRFVKMFKDATSYRLILISAPAGFGKTTALIQAITFLKNKHSVAWAFIGFQG